MGTIIDGGASNSVDIWKFNNRQTNYFYVDQTTGVRYGILSKTYISKENDNFVVKILTATYELKETELYNRMIHQKFHIQFVI